MKTDASIVEAALSLILAVFSLWLLYRIYFWPSIRAFRRDHPHRWAILMVNFFPGFGFVLALMWSYLVEPEPDTTDEFFHNAQPKLAEPPRFVQDDPRGPIRGGNRHERSAEDFIIR